MAGTRALFASIGASVAIVAAAALSLLAVSAVFAFGGWSESPAASVRQPDLIFAADPSASRSDGPDGPVLRTAAVQRPIIAAEPVARPKRRDASRAGDGRRENVRAAGEPATRRPADSTPAPGLNAAAPQPTPTPPPAAVATRKSNGDGVRKVGEDVSSAVAGTGTALAQVTAPLLPPISAAVQEVFNAVAALLAQTTQGLGAAVDALLPKK